MHNFNGRAIIKQNTLDICLTQLNNVFNAIFLVYIPAIEVAMHESTNIIEKTDQL